MSKYVFGNGSLLSRESRHRTFVETELHENVELKGYRRILNACCGEYMVMNIQPKDGVSIRGVVAKVEDVDFPALREREGNYDIVDVTDVISIDVGEAVCTFMAREPDCQGVPISNKYLLDLFS